MKLSRVGDGLNLEFGRRLRELRVEASMSQETLAEVASLSRTSVVNIEAGRQGVSLVTLYRLAAALTVHPQELLPEVSLVRAVPKIAIGPTTPDAEQAVMAVVRRAERVEAS